MDKDSNAFFLAFARNLVIQNGKKASGHFRFIEGWLKENRSLVTKADLEIQKSIETAIKENFPSHLFIGEETKEGKRPIDNEKSIWICDPIDGTESFACGLPIWGVSLAYYNEGRALVGVFYQPETGELFSACSDTEATLTLKPASDSELDRPLHVKPSPDIDHRSLMLVSSDFHRHFTSDFIGKQRNLGSVAAHICVVARGAALAAVFRAHIWDIAAAQLILQQAGGQLVDLETGCEMDLSKALDCERMPWMMAISSPAIYDRLRPSLHKR